jgi:hypothetical protein
MSCICLPPTSIRVYWTFLHTIDFLLRSPLGGIILCWTGVSGNSYFSTTGGSFKNLRGNAVCLIMYVHGEMFGILSIVLNTLEFVESARDGTSMRVLMLHESTIYESETKQIHNDQPKRHNKAAVHAYLVSEECSHYHIECVKYSNRITLDGRWNVWTGERR